ncbi:MAG: N-acetylmuramoyl-L-alanine amidase [Thermoleophilia bacterium]|jgi:N-acetylmuramoyl-L-alanine amidase|nr:N-acetylmuramoyl-L-alanine amidase [Thermoleophilia bacterium]
MERLPTHRTPLVAVLAVALTATLTLLAPFWGKVPAELGALIRPAQLEQPAALLHLRVLQGGPTATTTSIAAPSTQPEVRDALVPQYRAAGSARVYRERPAGFAPVAIVLHATGSGAPGSEFGSVDRLGSFFARPAARATSHYGVGRDGRILQFVGDEAAAFHVAARGWNDVSIGIELLNDNTGSQPFPRAQLMATTRLVRALAANYDIPLEAIVRHRDVQPADRSDPAGNFPWRAWRAALGRATG